MQLSWSVLALTSFFAVDAASSASPSASGAISPYVPQVSSCPSTLPVVRNGSGISRNESTWVAARQTKAKASMYTWLQTLNLSSSDMSYYTNTTNSSSKNVAVAVSGGGYRSLLIGAGVIKALDSRENTTNSTTTSLLSGFFQGTTYLSGLSGGGWLVSSIIGNNYSTVSALSSSLWQPSFAVGPFAYESNPQVTTDITMKSQTFDVSINDPWGRILSFQLLNGSDGGVSKTLSSIAQLPVFLNHSMPFPIMQALQIAPSACLATQNATQFEFSPFEFGSFSPMISGFVPTQYLGSNFSNSSVSSSSSCVTGFDNLGFMLGTTSCLFSAEDDCAPILGPNATSIIPLLNSPLMNSVMVQADGYGNDAIIPNPFYQRSQSPGVSTDADLHLVDGGLSGQNNPVWSLIQTARNVSLLVTVDNSADVQNFPSGTELQASYNQSLISNIPFPKIPSVATFSAKNLTQNPVLFGCGNASVPTILWLPNSQQASGFPANQSTTTVVFRANETQALINNGFLSATQSAGNTTAWARCLGCFVIYEGKFGNATYANGTKFSNTATNGTAGMSAECMGCFGQYCYN